MSGISQIKRPESLSKTAEHHIREKIVRGQYLLGQPLKEIALSSELGISKTPIREALAALNLQGLVHIFPQRGAFVFTLSKDDVVQLCGYRTLLENAALDLALEQNREDLLAALERVLDDMTEARENDDFQRYLDLDAEFHEAFFQHCGNDYLADGYRNVGDIVRTMRTYLSQRPSRTDKSYEEHVSILQLLREGRVDAAKKVLKTQITRGERAYSDLTDTSQL